MVEVLLARRDDAQSFSFDGVDDALNFARDCVERGNQWLARQSVNPLQHYREGHVDIVADLGAGSDPHIFNLVFRFVPLAVATLERTIHNSGEPRVAGDGLTHGQDEAVRIGIPYGVQTPEEVISSFVWLEAFKERSNFDWISAEALTVQFSFNACSTLGEGKAGVVGPGLSQGNGGSVASVIERVPKVPGGLFDDYLKIVSREGLRHPELVDFLAGVRIYINHAGVWARREKSCNSIFYLSNLRLCPSN